MFDKFFKKWDYVVDWDYVMTLPEFQQLEKCEQNPHWHSEGNALAHTKLCVEAAYKLLESDARYRNLEPRTAVACVLFHDIGKIATTQFFKGNWHAYGHEFASERIARRILWDENEKWNREIVCTCARYHMKALSILDSKKIIDEVLLLSRDYNFFWRYVIFTKHCDILGMVPEDPGEVTADLKKMDVLFDIAYSLGVIDRRFNFEYPESDRIAFSPDKKVAWYGPEHPRRKVYVLVGLPGAGKNTYYEKYLEKDGVVMISRDDIRHELGYCKEGEKVVLSDKEEKHVTEVFEDKLLCAIKAGKDVCLNNLNTKKKYRDAYKALLHGYLVEWVYVYVEAPTLEVNENRRPTFEPGVIRAMAETLEFPRIDEYDSFDYYLSTRY